MPRRSTRTRWLYRSLLMGCLAIPVAGLGQQLAPDPVSSTAVRQFKVEGNTLLSDSALDAVLQPFKGERSADELKQAALAVQQQYARAGYGAVVAFIPQQDLSAGVVTIQVLEGRLNTVAISGNQHFSQDNIRASLPSLVTGTTPRLDLVDVHIQMANENPSKQVKVLLQPGQATGDVAAQVTVEEKPVHLWRVGLDNRGNESTGRLRANLIWQHANVLQRDHVFTGQVQFSPDKLQAVKVIAAAYHVPLYASRTAVDVYAAYSDVKAGATPTLAGDLQFNGRGRLAGARVTRYLTRLGEFDQRVSLGLDHRDYVNSCSIADLPPGACGTAGESVSVQPISIDYSLQKGGSPSLGMVLSLSHNLQLGGGHSSDANFEAVRPGAKPRYTALSGNAQANAALNDGLSVYARFAFQTTPHALVPGEQFGIGGANSVRGYEERELSGDRGALASVELLGPNLLAGAGASSAGGSQLRPVVFADAGWISNHLDTPCLVSRSRCTLYSAGFGARWSHEQLQVQFFIAQAFKAAARTERDDVRAHFALSYAF